MADGGVYADENGLAPNKFVPAVPVVKEAGGYKLFLSSESRNESGYKGVRQTLSGRFHVRCTDSALKSDLSLGTYDTAVEAAVEYAKHMAAKGVYPDGKSAAQSDGSGNVGMKRGRGRPRKHVDQGPSHHDGPPPIDNDGFYEVEKICEERQGEASDGGIRVRVGTTDGGRVAVRLGVLPVEPQFRIRWKGYGRDHDTWEPLENLQAPRVKAMVAEYNRAQRQRVES